tara:strand:+ start:2172 stop:2447 length:276 start_codon:yes stop_codon:yes gene_type:complete
MTEAQVKVHIEKEVNRRINNALITRDITQKVKMFSVQTITDLAAKGMLKNKETDLTVEDIVKESVKIEEYVWGLVNLPAQEEEPKPSRIIS